MKLYGRCYYDWSDPDGNINTGAALLSLLSWLRQSHEPERDPGDTYGYKIAQDVRGVLDISESTLYPVLGIRAACRNTDDCLEKIYVYDQAYAGRNRRYYKLTEKGQAQLNLYKIEWKNYSTKIGSMFEDVGRNADSGHMREEN